MKNFSLSALHIWTVAFSILSSKSIVPEQGQTNNTGIESEKQTWKHQDQAVAFD